MSVILPCGVPAHRALRHKIYGSSRGIHACYSDIHGLSEHVSASGPFSYKYIPFFIISIEIICQITDADHPLHGVGEFNIDAPARYAGNSAGIIFADPFFHVLGFLKFYGLPLYFRGSLLHCGASGSRARKVKIEPVHCILVHLASQPVLEASVYQKIRVSADWRCEVTIILKREAEVPLTSRRVLRFLHTAKDDPAEHGLFRPSLHLLEKMPDLGGMNIALPGLEPVSESSDKL